MQCCDLLHVLGVPFLHSKFEAEAYCALLDSTGVRRFLYLTPTPTLALSKALLPWASAHFPASAHHFYSSVWFWRVLYVTVHHAKLFTEKSILMHFRCHENWAIASLMSTNFQWLLNWLLHKWREGLENNLPTFRLNAPVIMDSHPDDDWNI